MKEMIYKYDPQDYDDVRTYCDIYECKDCPRLSDDCDGEEECDI